LHYLCTIKDISSLLKLFYPASSWCLRHLLGCRAGTEGWPIVTDLLSLLDCIITFVTKFCVSSFANCRLILLLELHWLLVVSTFRLTVQLFSQRSWICFLFGLEPNLTMTKTSANASKRRTGFS
jgi:hypothetical protein